MIATAHPHVWSVVGFDVADGRPRMRQSCTCAAERTVPAWDRSWTPPAEWRPVAGTVPALFGRLLQSTQPLDGLARRPTMPEALTVDAWSDVACPWCYIGKRNLEAGIAAADRPVAVTYHSFELAPDTPVDFEGSERDYLARVKGIGAEQAAAMLDHVSRVAAAAGLEYDFDSVRHTRTVKAHQLLHYAKARGSQQDAKERLLRAYFVEGRHIGRDEVLAELAHEIGLDADDVLRSLRADEFLGAVRADQQRAMAHGIRGVPFYVIDGRFALSGAQPPETFASALQHAASQRATA